MRHAAFGGREQPADPFRRKPDVARLDLEKSFASVPRSLR
jgi:hypothetical protein